MAMEPTDIEELDDDTTASLFEQVQEATWFPPLSRHVRDRAGAVPAERLQGFERPNGRRVVVLSENVGEAAVPGASMTFTFEDDRIIDARAETHPSASVLEYVVPSEFAPEKDEMDTDIHGVPGAQLRSVEQSDQLTLFELELPAISE